MRGDYAAAIRACDEALASSPPSADVHCTRARAHRALGKLDQAIADAMTALRLDPHHAWAHRTLAEVHLAQGNVKAAIASCDEAIRLDPFLAQAYNTRAGARLLCNQLRSALADSNEAIRLAPRLWGAHVTRGNVRYHLGDPNAIDDYHASFRINPRGHVWGVVQVIAQQVRQGPIHLFDNCAAHLRRNPRDPVSYGRRGIALVLLGKDGEAQNDLDQMALIDPAMLEQLPLLIAEAKRVRASAPAK
jgi:tetratricopeptide (TPR) repeat protein